MQFHDDENEKLNRRHAHSNSSSEEYDQYAGLSDAWTELLGIHTLGVQAVPNISAVVPPVASDPWNELLHAQGVQVIDLQEVHLHSVDAHQDDLDVEQALHVMQELPIVRTNDE